MFSGYPAYANTTADDPEELVQMVLVVREGVGEPFDLNRKLRVGAKAKENHAGVDEPQYTECALLVEDYSSSRACENTGTKKEFSLMAEQRGNNQAEELSRAADRISEAVRELTRSVDRLAELAEGRRRRGEGSALFELLGAGGLSEEAAAALADEAVHQARRELARERGHERAPAPSAEEIERQWKA